jgi:hypothetical protein
MQFTASFSTNKYPNFITLLTNFHLFIGVAFGSICFVKITTFRTIFVSFHVVESAAFCSLPLFWPFKLNCLFLSKLTTLHDFYFASSLISSAIASSFEFITPFCIIIYSSPFKDHSFH